MPRPSLAEGLYVSVSQLKTFLRCPRQFELRYVRGLRPAFVPGALAFGVAFHRGLAAYYDELRTAGVPLALDRLVEVFQASWEDIEDEEIPIQLDDEATAEALVARGRSMLAAFHEHASGSGGLTVEAVERPFSIVLRHPDSGEPLEERLVGTMDLIVVDQGRRMVVEHKSSSRRWSDEALRFDFQSTAYRIAAREEGLGEVALRYQIVTKTRIPVIQVADVERTVADEKDFLRTANDVLRAIDAGVSYPVRSWACRSCPYSFACEGAS